MLWEPPFNKHFRSRKAVPSPIWFKRFGWCQAVERIQNHDVATSYVD